MKYLTENDLNAHIQIRLKNESQADFETAIETIEVQNIELVKGYLADLYHVDLIFDEDEPVGNEIIKKIITTLCLYDLIRRNAARKVPSDYRQDYEDAMAQLSKIQAGKIKLNGFPPAKDDAGAVLSDSIYANNRNENYFI